MTARILPPSPDSIALAADALKRGGLVAMPTETVYGLAADATSDSAVAALYEAKGRPRFNPLIAHVASLEAAAMQAVLSDEALVLAAAFWPGPLTLVLPVSKSCSVCDLARAGLDTIAVRMPAHPVARALLKAFGGPLVAPSANPSGRVSPTTAAHVAADMGEQVEAILDGGPCDLGLESTIVDCTGNGPALLRAGALATDEIEAVYGTLRRPGSDPQTPSSPGQLLRHYAPKAALRLNAAAPAEDEAFLGFGPGDATLNLSESANLREAAANLFAMLRTLDSRHDRIAVAPIPSTGLGEAINDRLRRAAQR